MFSCCSYERARRVGGERSQLREGASSAMHGVRAYGADGKMSFLLKQILELSCKQQHIARIGKPKQLLRIVIAMYDENCKECKEVQVAWVCLPSVLSKLLQCRLNCSPWLLINISDGL